MRTLDGGGGSNFPVKEVCAHIGSCNHRLENTAGIFSDRPGVKKTMVTRYLKSSQAAGRLIHLCNTIQLDDLRVIKDVETRYPPTFAMILRLLYLEGAIKLCRQLGRLVALLLATDWVILRQLKPALSSTGVWADGKNVGRPG